MAENLNEALKAAWSCENREAHESYGDTEYIGTTKIGNRLYDLVRDSDGKYFYSVRIITPDGKVKSEYEAIFGRPEPPAHHKNTERNRMAMPGKPKEA